MTRPLLKIRNILSTKTDGIKKWHQLALVIDLGLGKEVK